MSEEELEEESSEIVKKAIKLMEKEKEIIDRCGELIDELVSTILQHEDKRLAYSNILATIGSFLIGVTRNPAQAVVILNVLLHDFLHWNEFRERLTTLAKLKERLEGVV